MRKPRVIVEGATYHVTARINRGEYIFEDNPFLKEMFIDIIHHTHELYKFSACAVTIMDNHIHMMIQPEENERLDKIMNSILSTFARRYNTMYNLHGHVWYDRFKSKVIATKKQLVNTLRYICNNPVRAGIIKNPVEYKFSTLNAIFSKVKTNLVQQMLDLFDSLDEEIRQLYEDYINEFDPVNASQVDLSVGFYPGKPGRPKKI